MDTPKVFKTKTGYCHVLQDKIVLTRDGVIGQAAKLTMGNNISRPLIIYGIISIGLLYTAYNEYSDGRNVPAFVFLMLCLFLLFAIFKSLNNSATPIVDKAKIKHIEFRKAVLGVTRSYFIIHFANDKGQLRKRLILLPGSLSDGHNETERALQIMTKEFPTMKNGS